MDLCGALDPQEAASYLKQHPELLELASAQAALEHAHDIEAEKIRLFQASETDWLEFQGYAACGYAIADYFGQHELCALAAEMLAKAWYRRGLNRRKELWSFMQFLHSALAYPCPKFSSTFDILVTQTLAVIELPVEAGDLTALEFILQTSTQVSRLIGQSAVDELLKFLVIPHDAYTVAISLVYLAYLRAGGLDTRAVQPEIVRLAQRASEMQIINAAVDLFNLADTGSGKGTVDEAFLALVQIWKASHPG